MGSVGRVAWAVGGSTREVVVDSGGNEEVLISEGHVEPESIICPWEVETPEPQETPLVVKGRLKEHLSYWREELQAPPPILDIIEHGYVLPLKSEPTPFARKNQASADTNGAFVGQSVSELLASGCIQEVASAPHICSPLSVVESSTGKKSQPQAPQ